MTAPALRLPHLGWPDLLVRALGIATAALLAIDAFVHFDDAHFYDFSAGGSVTQGTLFRIEASVAILVAVALLVWPHWIVWVVAILVAGSAAGAVYLYTYVDVGRLGPLPDMYEPTWALPGKRLTAGAEIAATVTAVLGLAAALYARLKSRNPDAAAGSSRPARNPSRQRTD